MPNNIEELLTPVGLAHLIMGNGFLDDSGAVRLCTDNFTREKLLIFSGAFYRKFGLRSSVIKRTNPGEVIKWRIRFSTTSMPNLVSLVNSHFIPEMRYKLGI